MPESAADRPARLAAQFEAAQEQFIRLVESVSDDQWRLQGRNHPQLRLNDEDEDRPVGVIAHHVAVSGDWIMNRIQAILDDQPTPPVDFKVINAQHAREHAGTTKEEVLAHLRESGRRIGEAVRAIPDAKLDLERQLPSGVMTLQQRIERVLIGHIQSHQGSIEASL
jgi:hypothetical protein